MSIYFSGVSDLDILKKLYRELCKKHHPVLGGDVEVMKAVNVEFEAALKYVTDQKGNRLNDEAINIEKDIMDMVQKIITLKGLIIEVCGRWIWITGDTYTWKSTLKGLKFCWAFKKRAWYWRPANARVWSKHQIRLVAIRQKYGSIGFEVEEREAIA